MPTVERQEVRFFSSGGPGFHRSRLRQNRALLNDAPARGTRSSRKVQSVDPGLSRGNGWPAGHDHAVCDELPVWRDRGLTSLLVKNSDSDQQGSYCGGGAQVDPTHSNLFGLAWWRTGAGQRRHVLDYMMGDKGRSL